MAGTRRPSGAVTGDGQARPRVLPAQGGLPAYLAPFGNSEHDLSGRGSDRLVDALVPHGGLDHVIGRLAEHLRAGASQVAVQPLTLDTQIGSGNRRLPMAEFRALAGALPVADAVEEVHQSVAGG